MDKHLDESRNSLNQAEALAPDDCGPVLSALIDGQADAGEVAQACAAWRDGSEARAQWHRYLLVGDVMRSDELAARPAADERFLQALRVRLANEAVPLAPRATSNGPTQRGLRWRRVGGPLAMAAGFAAVAGMVWVLRAAPEETASPVLARNESGLRGANSSPAVEEFELVRDRTIDRYLEDRRQQSIRRVAQPDGSWLRKVDNSLGDTK